MIKHISNINLPRIGKKYKIIVASESCKLQRWVYGKKMPEDFYRKPSEVLKPGTILQPQKFSQSICYYQFKIIDSEVPELINTWFSIWLPHMDGIELEEI